MTDALLVEDVHTYYGDSYVLQGVSLRVAPGQLVAVLGRNGVGKTTLIRSVVGFTPRGGGASGSGARRSPTGPATPSPAWGWGWCRKADAFSRP